MASVDLIIQNGASPYQISVKKLGDPTERYVSYVGTTLTFNASSENQNVNYNIKVTDSVPCESNAGFSINCAIVIPEPDFNATLFQPICNPDGTYQPAILQLSGITNATRYKICYNTVSFDCGDCTVSDGIITGSSQNITLSTPTVPTSRFFIFRAYNGDTCLYFKEFSGTIITTSCEEACEMEIVLGSPTC